VRVVDTTGAGDSFAGALAAALAAGASRDEALRSAVAAGTEACTWPGAQGWQL
jgi:ribokinase